MTPGVLHLHTYFLFPFSIDKHTVIDGQPDVWKKYPHWMDGLDAWMGEHQARGSSPLVDRLGPWKRAAYTHFDLDSPAYQDMTFFHPFVRRVFFDTGDPAGGGEKDALLRCYAIPTGSDTGRKLWFRAGDPKGRSATVEVTDLRLFLFANGIGILSLGVEAFRLSVQDALWINEAMRKVYPSSRRQLREGRIPNRLSLEVERGGATETIVEERFENGAMIGFQPPLAATITSLLYFADYSRQEYEPMLDDRMIVYSYLALDPATVSPEFLASEDYQILLSRFLYVDRDGAGYRYEPGFTRERMKEQMYRRWSHQGTYYGFTSYSNVTATVGTFDCDEHLLREGFLIHRMFDSRYYLMGLVALFYRATLLDFAERTALVSKQLYLDQEDGKLTLENIRHANDLRADFLHFSNYWHFDELANKDEEIEHFALQCREYRTDTMRHEIEEEIDKLNASLFSYYQFRNTEAVNRLAMLSLMFGAGAVLTGFFGMNFGREFARIFFEPDRDTLVIHNLAVAAVVLLAFGALTFGVWVVAANWGDYREILKPGKKNTTTGGGVSLKRG